MKYFFSIRILTALLIACAISIIPSTVYAHEGGNLPLGGFLSGLVHPVLGYDHLLAMLSVGILSAQIGGRAIWTVPATFVSVMALGGVLGLVDVGIKITELGIAFSLVILGSVIASERRLPIILAMIGVGFFAIFHGYAHGTEMPQTAQPVAYAFGFLTGTALIHITGVLIGDISKRYQRGPQVLRFGGGLIAMVGLLFVFGII
jgi:urease accessory protein